MTYKLYKHKQLLSTFQKRIIISLKQFFVLLLS